MNYEKNVSGIFIPKSIANRADYELKHPDDKAFISKELWGWKRADVPMHRWMDCHAQGFTFASGNMRSIPRPTFDGGQEMIYTHREALWHGTDWLVLDLDHDDIDTHDATSLPLIDPEVENLVFGLRESVSCNIDGRFARWHGFVLLERTITTRQEYNALLEGLGARLWTMTGANRQPCQPIYGNARENAYQYLMENVLTNPMMDELIAEGRELQPKLQEVRPQKRELINADSVANFVSPINQAIRKNYDDIEPKELGDFLARYRVPVYEGKLDIDDGHLYLLPCLFRADHSSDVLDASTFIKVAKDGKWGYSCFHHSCQDRIERADKSGWKLFKEAVTCPLRMGLKTLGVSPSRVRHGSKARVYDNVCCPRNNAHRGTALYRKADGQCVFLCDTNGCEPVKWQEFMSIHREMGVSA